ncbi:protein-disulfide reductase DsbD family protein [Candidatus Omnitrophota bacterium]
MLETLLSYTEITLKEVSILSYLIVFLGGILASLTPCVYPLIPVTAAYIGANSSGSKRRGFVISLFYVLGLAIVYSFLGMFAALSGKLFGSISTNPWTYLIVGNIFLIFGLSMFDLFTIPMPAFLQSKTPASRKRGIIGALIIGMSAGFVIGPCTAPALGAVLTYVASRGNVILGGSLLFTFAMGMGLLLMIVGTFAGFATTLPKSGKWMNIVKKVFGLILIICAEYFIILAGKGF